MPVGGTGLELNDSLLKKEGFNMTFRILKLLAQTLAIIFVLLFISGMIYFVSLVISRNTS